jgi:NADPH-dependent glutamate synthase beta subunit-like oxidoreductase
MAAAQQLNRAGHTVTVLKETMLLALLRYGIPNFKLEKEESSTDVLY